MKAGRTTLTMKDLSCRGGRLMISLGRLPSDALLETVEDGVDMPVVQELLARIDRVEALQQEDPQVRAQGGEVGFLVVVSVMISPPSVVEVFGLAAFWRCATYESRMAS